MKWEYDIGLGLVDDKSCSKSLLFESLLTRVKRSWSDRVRCGGNVDVGWLRREPLLGKWKLVTDVDALVKSSSAIWERNGNVDGIDDLPFPPAIERNEWP